MSVVSRRVTILERRACYRIRQGAVNGRIKTVSEGRKRKRARPCGVPS